MRNVVAVGADPTRIALLDNFCWGNTDRPETLGSLVRAAEACRDVALAYGTPFISGKDSLNNEYHSRRQSTSPSRRTLLISAIGQVPDVRRCVTMDLKEPGNVLYLVGATATSWAARTTTWSRARAAATVPRVDLELAPKLFAAVHAAIAGGPGAGLPRPERGRPGRRGGGDGVRRRGRGGPDGPHGRRGAGGRRLALFSESPTRFVVEVEAGRTRRRSKRRSPGLPLAKVGATVKEPRLRIAGASGEWMVWAKLDELKEAWQKPLRW